MNNNNTVNAPSVALRYTTEYTLTVTGIEYAVSVTHTTWGGILTSVVDTTTGDTVAFPIWRDTGHTVDTHSRLVTPVEVSEYHLAGLIGGAVAYANATYEWNANNS
jgi:hypothetical protein